jgi:hypothetical protein
MIKHDGFISKEKTIEDWAQRINNLIVLEKNIKDKGVEDEGQPSKVEPYWHLHHQKEDLKYNVYIYTSSFPRRKMVESIIFREQRIKEPLFNEILLKANNYNNFEKL